MTVSATVQWWKDKFSDINKPDIPSKCPSIEAATEIWGKISPIIFANIDTNDDDATYWGNVRNIVQKITNNNDVPDPKAQLSKFWDKLYQHKDILAPSTPEQCLPFIDHFCPSPCNDFFVLDFPRSVNNPMLSLRTYQYLHNKHYPKWVDFIENENGSIGRLMDYFLPFLTPLLGQFDPMFWQYRLEMCDLIVNLVTSNFEKIPLVDDFIISLNSKITAILSDAPLEFAADFVRYAIQLNKISLPRIKPETATRRLLNLLQAAPPGTIAHAPLVRFAYKDSSDFMPTEVLAKYLINQGLTCSYDLEILAAIAIQPKATAVAVTSVTCQLARVMTLDPIFGRSATLLFAKVLARAKNIKDTQEWVEIYIRRLTIFVALAFAKKRYSGRIVRIAEILSHPDLKRIKWLIESINLNISSMIHHKLNPSFFENLSSFTKGEVNENEDVFKTEYDLFLQDHVNLKRFPFGLIGNVLFETELTKPKTKAKKKKPQRKSSPRKGSPSKLTKGSKNAGTKTETKAAEQEKEEPAKKKGRRPKWNA